MSTRRALVVGGSLGGLIAAHMLRGAGWDVTVFERNAEELASRGVGLGTHPQLIAILKRAGIDFDESMGIKPPRADRVRAADRAHLERLVTALPRAARRAAGAKLSARQAARPRRAGHRQC